MSHRPEMRAPAYLLSPHGQHLHRGHSILKSRSTAWNFSVAIRLAPKFRNCLPIHSKKSNTAGSPSHLRNKGETARA